MTAFSHALPTLEDKTSHPDICWISPHRIGYGALRDETPDGQGLLGQIHANNREIAVGEPF
ncbi:MAG: hypothetical protein PF501_08650 [Salinisphaera sp.]|nr:hypothetical protein [Salinisphaera sp.]